MRGVRSGGAELSDSDLEAVAGGALDVGAFQLAVKKLNEMVLSVSNVLKTRHDTAKNSISNVR